PKQRTWGRAPVIRPIQPLLPLKAVTLGLVRQNYSPLPQDREGSVRLIAAPPPQSVTPASLRRDPLERYPACLLHRHTRLKASLSADFLHLDLRVLSLEISDCVRSGDPCAPELGYHLVFIAPLTEADGFAYQGKVHFLLLAEAVRHLV